MSCPVTSLTYRCAIPALLCAATTPHVASSRTNKCPIPPESATHASSGHPRLSDSGKTDNQDGRITPQTSDSAESDNQRRRANHTLISEPTTTSATPIQNGMPNATPNRSVLEAVENSGVAYEPIASVSILPCSMPYPQHA